MLSRLQLLLFLPVFLWLVACTIVEDKPVEPETLTETNTYSAWQLSDAERRSASSNRAVSLLLAQADELIAAENFDQAGDKLERLVRIEPKSAQAWSRLAWMSLKNGEAKRSQQLAQRSNSYARDNTRLKILNWNFIQKAAELLNDADLVQQAQKMLMQLGSGE